MQKLIHDRGLSALGRKLRTRVEVGRDFALVLDVPIDEVHLLGADLQRAGSLLGADIMVIGPEREVHALPGQREVELFLRLRQRIGVGRRCALLDLLREPERGGQRKTCVL
jgi:hypothetical protein